MREKALVIGAPPSAWEGPVIGLSDGRKWAIRPEGDYRGAVEVRYTPRGKPSPVSRSLHDEVVVIEDPATARVVILEEAERLDLRTISVNARMLESR